ncbi:hypothetical protein DFH06DRAFT_1349810 [Mycena polygramma]|nr:hypothetical protein DFH06DRAFT_1349810 [Mycena polygramma]
MPPHTSPSSPLNPNARSFPYPPTRPPLAPYSSTSRFASSPYATPHLALSRYAARPPGVDPASPLTPPSRAPPLASIACDVLDRGRTNTFGPEDSFPRTGSAVARVRVASNAQWVRHRSGQPPLVRPGSVVAPQTLYTGREMRPNGQELHHAVFLNSRMLIHDPVTGRPGMINGHAVTTLVAVPPDNRTWEFECAYPGVRDVRTLTTYGPATQAEVGRQRREGRYRLAIDRHIERLSTGPLERSARDVSNGFPLTPTLPAVPLPSIHQVLQSPPPNLLTPPPSRVLQAKKKSFFYTHPPNVPPYIDTSAMTHTGFAVDTGHRVLEFPSRLQTSDDTSSPKRPDTPGPRFRLLTEPPALIDESAETRSDVSMPPVSPDDSDAVPPVPAIPESALATPGQQSTTTQAEGSATSTQKQPTSNVRLEKLRYEARRCAMSESSPATRSPQYVFSAYSARGAASEAGSVRVAQSCAPVQEENIDSCEPEEYEVKGRSSSGSEMSIVSTAPSDAGPVSRDSHGDDYFTARSSSPTHSSSSSETGTGSASPADAGNSDDRSPSRAFVAAIPGTSNSFQDCRSTLPSPHHVSPSNDDSDSDAPPSLRPISPDDDGTRDESQSYVTYYFPLILADDRGRLVLRSRDVVTTVSKDEVDGYLARIGRAPPSPSNQSWVLNQDWTQRRDHFLQNLQNAENADALAGIRHVEAFLDQSPELLDRARMHANVHLDTDLVNQLQYPAVTRAGCKEFAERMQQARDARDAYSPGLLDASRPIHNITHIPVSYDGKRLRQLSDRAIKQPLMYRYAIELIVRQHLEWITPYSELRKKYLALLYYLDDLSKRRRGRLDQTFLHQRCPIPPPFLHPHEYGRLRILKYNFEHDGQVDLGRALDGLLRYRFKETEVVSHLLYAGMFDPKDVLLTNDGTFKEIARRIVMASLLFRPFLCAFRNSNVQDKRQLSEISTAQGSLTRHL